MFETEAEFYAREKYSPKTDSFIVAVADDAFRDGATFGYNKAKEEGKVVVEHFEAYGQCRDSRRIADLEAKNAKLQAKIDDWQSEYIELENFKNNEIAELKEIIKQFLNDYPVITKELLDKLEQFVKEIKENGEKVK